MNYYIHVPFCASKCGYCAFYSEAGAAVAQIDAYLTHLDRVLASASLETAETLYVGGGTPTYLDYANLERFLEIIRTHFSFVPDAEISIEANPETLDERKVRLLRKHFTRISLGIQSFDPALRERIGRNCSQEKLLEAVELVKSAGFPHWNCDLIYAIPGQSRAMWEKDLHLAAQLGGDHISCHALTPEENSRLGAELTEDDDRALEFYHAAQQILHHYGIERYEISNYAFPGGECRHNQSVWRGGLLRGFGPAAAGFDGVNRIIQVESLSGWLKGEPPELDIISTESRLNEIFAVNLRTVAGWTPELWNQLPGADSWEQRLEIAGNLQKIFPDGLLIDENSIKLTENGLLFWNSIAQELF